MLRPTVSLLLLVAGSLLPLTSGASEIQLPRTGQTTCYDASGNQISCSGAGQDGAFQAGVTWPSPRFTAANGTVTDNLTGLVWLQNANCFGTSLWASALSNANGLASGSCGLSDGSTAGQWRLPTQNELETLVDAANCNPALPSGHPFGNVQSSTTYSYWTSSTSAINSGWGGVVSMYYGNVNTANKSAHYNYIWPVRTAVGTGKAPVPATGQTVSYGTADDGALRPGVAWPVPRFTDNGNGTVTDNLTGLIWLKNANCTETVGTIGKSAGTLAWIDAVTWSNGLASPFCGLRDVSVPGSLHTIPS